MYHGAGRLRQGNSDQERASTTLIQTATRTVSQWKYKPLLLNGKAVETDTIVVIDFQLLEEREQPDSKVTKEE